MIPYQGIIVGWLYLNSTPLAPFIIQFQKISFGFLSLCYSLICSSQSYPPTLRSKTCVIPSKYKSSNGTADGSATVAPAFAKCSTNAVVRLSEDVDYNIFSPISATNLSNLAITCKAICTCRRTSLTSKQSSTPPMR